MAVAVVVAVAGVISVGHGHGDVHDRDHHPPLRLGAKVRLGKVSLSAAFRDVAALVAGLRCRIPGGEGPRAATVVV